MFSRDGCDPRFWQGFDHAKLDEMPLELKKAYLASAPHPEQLPSFFAKSVQRMREFKGWTPAQIRTIRSPTFLIVGDRDIVRVEHAVHMQHLLPDARLAVFPAADHLAMTERAADLASMLDEFLLRGANASRHSRR
jgi:pimeloyl-ACP methyl ester carboxylesterase